MYRATRLRARAVSVVPITSTRPSGNTISRWSPTANSSTRPLTVTVPRGDSVSRRREKSGAFFRSGVTWTAFLPQNDVAEEPLRIPGIRRSGGQQHTQSPERSTLTGVAAPRHTSSVWRVNPATGLPTSMRIASVACSAATHATAVLSTPCVSQVGELARPRRIGKDASEARPAPRVHGHHRSVGPEDAAVDPRLARFYRCVVHQVPGLDVVRSVEHEVGRLEELVDVRRGDVGDKRLDGDPGVHRPKPACGGGGLRQTFLDIPLVEEELSLEVVQLEHVPVGEEDPADARAGQQLGLDAAEGAASHDEHGGLGELPLSRLADDVEDGLPGIARAARIESREGAVVRGHSPSAAFSTRSTARSMSSRVCPRPKENRTDVRACSGVPPSRAARGKARGSPSCRPPRWRPHAEQVQVEREDLPLQALEGDIRGVRDPGRAPPLTEVPGTLRRISASNEERRSARRAASASSRFAASSQALPKPAMAATFSVPGREPFS